MTFYNKDGWYNNIFGEGVNVFGAGPTSTQTKLATPVDQGGYGLLKPEELERAKKRSLTKGLLGTVVNYLAQPKNQGYGSGVPYIAKAFGYGMDQANEPFAGLETTVEKDRKYNAIVQNKELIAKLSEDPRVQNDPILKSAVFKDPMGVYKVLNDKSQQTPYNLQELQAEVAYLQSLPENNGRSLTDITQQAFRNIQERKRAQTNVTVEAPIVETEYEKSISKYLGEEDGKFIKTAKNAPANIGKIDDTIRLIRNPKTQVGKGTGLVTDVQAVAMKFLDVNGNIKEEISNTQLLDKLMGSDVFKLIEALGIGARGLDTPEERKFLQGVMVGDIDHNRDTLTKMNMIRRRTFAKAIEEYNRRLEAGHFDKLKTIGGLQAIMPTTGADSTFIARITDQRGDTPRDFNMYSDGTAFYLDENGNPTDEQVKGVHFLDFNYDF